MFAHFHAPLDRAFSHPYEHISFREAGSFPSIEDVEMAQFPSRTPPEGSASFFFPPEVGVSLLEKVFCGKKREKEEVRYKIVKSSWVRPW
jgi:hypothetical protein